MHLIEVGGLISYGRIIYSGASLLEARGLGPCQPASITGQSFNCVKKRDVLQRSEVQYQVPGISITIL